MTPARSARARISSLGYAVIITVGISLPNRDKLLCRSRPLILGMSKSTTKHPVRLSSGECKNSSPDENAWATNPIERIKTLIAFPTASSSSTIATIGPLFGTWQPRAGFTEERISSARLFRIQPTRDYCVLRLYKCIENSTIGIGGPKFCDFGASCLTGSDLDISSSPLLAHKNPSSLDRAGGASEAAGSG